MKNETVAVGQWMELFAKYPPQDRTPRSAFLNQIRSSQTDNKEVS